MRRLVAVTSIVTLLAAATVMVLRSVPSAECRQWQRDYEAAANPMRIGGGTASVALYVRDQRPVGCSFPDSVTLVCLEFQDYIYADGSLDRERYEAAGGRCDRSGS